MFPDPCFPSPLPSVPPTHANPLPSPAEPVSLQWQPGSAGAHRVLDDFVRSGRLKAFDADRAKTDRASTSRLSPHIHYGEVSVRHMHYVAKHQQLEWARCAGVGGRAPGRGLHAGRPCKGHNGVQAAWFGAPPPPALPCRLAGMLVAAAAHCCCCCCRSGEGGTSVPDFLRQLGYRE